MRSTTARRLASMVLSVALVAACDFGPKTPLRIGLLVWPPYELAVLARDLGHLDDAAIEFVDYESPAAVQRAYLDGAIDALMVTADYLLQMAAETDQHRVVLVVDYSEGGDVLMARPEIDSPAALRGKRVGVEKSALGAYVLVRALEMSRLSKDDVVVVPADIPDQERLYREGAIDAVITYEPTRTRLIASGARELFSSREIPGEIVDVLVTNLDVIDRHRKDLQVFVRGWMKALAHLRSDPQDAASRVAEREGLTPDAYLQALTGVRIPDLAENQALLSPGPASLSHALDRHVEVMLREDLLPRRIATRTLLDPQFVEAAGAP